MSQSLTPSVLYLELAQECELAMQLVDVLLEEQSSLIRMETERLAELALRKEGLMFELEKRFLANAQRAVADGYADNLEGLNDWIAHKALGQEQLLGTFTTLKSTLAHAQKLNEANGELVEEQLAGIQQRISILTAASVQKNTGDTAGTYGPKGGLFAQSGVKPRAVIR